MISHSELIKKLSKTKSDFKDEYIKVNYDYPKSIAEFRAKYKPVIEPQHEYINWDKNLFNYIGVNDDNRLSDNVYLRKPFSSIEISKAQEKEFIKCRDNPIYFIENYLYVSSDTDSGLCLMTLYDYQKELIQSITDNKYVAANIARQMGKTAIAVAIMVHMLIFRNRYDIGIVSQDETQSKEIVSRILTGLENLPDFLKGGIVSKSALKIELDNGSKVRGFASSASSLRGKSFGFLYGDEVAFINEWEEIQRAMMPIIARFSSKKMLLTSTPNGLNHWHKIINEDKRFNSFTYDWRSLPDNLFNSLTGAFDDGKKFETDNNSNRITWLGEFCVNFVGSSDTLLSKSELESIELLGYQFKDFNGIPLRQFKAIRPINDNGFYCLAVDLSSGVGKDYLSISVIDTEKGEVVGTLKSNHINDSYQVYKLIIDISDYFNSAYVIVENNHHSFGSIMAFAAQDDRECFYKDMTKKSFGFNMDKRKLAGCELLRTAIQRGFKINCEMILEELLTFVSNGKSYAAQKGSNDDMAMSLIIFFTAINNQQNHEMMESYFENMKIEDRFDNLNEYERECLYYRQQANSSYGCGYSGSY